MPLAPPFNGLLNSTPSNNHGAGLSLLQAKYQHSEARNRALEEEVTLLKEQLNWFQAQMFGRSSEKRTVDECVPGQGNLFNEAEVTADAAPSAPEAVTIPAHRRRKRGRKALPADLPRVEVLHDIPASEKTCTVHDKALVVIGRETSEQLDYIPAKVQVLHHVRLKYACPCCENNLKVADKPAQILPKSNASPSLLAHVVTAKYMDALPLHRQERQFTRLGLTLGRATLANWMIRLGEQVVPLINLMNDQLLESPLIHCDETSLQVIKGRESQQHWMWVRGGGPPGQRVVLFDHDPTRSGEVPKRLLDDYGGILMTDGYERYDAAVTALRQKRPGLIHCGCWAHARRYFQEAHKIARGERRAREALDFIGELYAIERRLKTANAEPAKRLAARQSGSRAVIERFKSWLDQQSLQVVPKSALGKAVQYTLKQWPKLLAFLDHPVIPLDNNWAENGIRPFVIGRKNFLFAYTPRGADASARLYSLVESAKANGLEPHAYLKYVFEVLPNAKSVEDYEALLPWRVKETVKSLP